VQLVEFETTGRHHGAVMWSSM